MSVPGEYESLTLAAWVRVQGLDRQINSLFMSDGFEAGTVHWSIRDDGVLGLTAIGSEPGRYQICASPPALTLGDLGPLDVGQLGELGLELLEAFGREVFGLVRVHVGSS
jgi:hypothetical protein